MHDFVFLDPHIKFRAENTVMASAPPVITGKIQILPAGNHLSVLALATSVRGAKDVLFFFFLFLCHTALPLACLQQRRVTPSTMLCLEGSVPPLLLSWPSLADVMPADCAAPTVPSHSWSLEERVEGVWDWSLVAGL